MSALGTDETAPSPAPRPGERLRAAREALGLGTAEVAAKLKLSVRQVEAMEADDWSALPERPFARGFFRNYARLVAIDPDSLGLDAKSDRVATAPITSPLDATTQLESPVPGNERLGAASARRRAPWLIPLTLAIILAAGAVYLHHSGNSTSLRPQTVWPTPAPPAAASGGAQPMASSAGSQPSSPPGAPGQPPRAPDSPGDAATTSTVPTGSSPPAPAGGSGPAAAPTTDTPALLAPVKPREGEAAIRLTFSGRSWTEVRSKGEVVFSETATPGTREFTAARPLSFVIGNASAVRLEIDGKVHDFTPSTRSDVARFQIP